MKSLFLYYANCKKLLYQVSTTDMYNTKSLWEKASRFDSLRYYLRVSQKSKILSVGMIEMDSQDHSFILHIILFFLI